MGTRSSKLAVYQTEMFLKRLQLKDNEIVKVTSHGDESGEKSLKEIGGTGLFVKKLNDMILLGDIHCAVHSAKDMPGDMDENLEVSAVFDWENFHDVIVLREGENPKDQMTVGTSSSRREKQISRIYPQWKIKNIRGNIDTRLQKLENGTYDGIILSEAGLRRLYPNREFKILDESICVPATNQGIIAVVSTKDGKFNEKIKAAEDPVARKRFNMERSVSNVLDFGCSSPNGIFYDPIRNLMFLDINAGEAEISIRKKINSEAEALTLARQVREMVI
ncbi:hydroxymethylbilane synthase [Cuniculiplasma sp. SKW3]|uniref:hydroxymethylbilane synthase n=1 Tax=Cuniculiplasma sp. SKW3 TaxID=3400170 RepID=UPI003FD50208